MINPKTDDKGLHRVKVGCCGFPWRCHRRFIALELEKQGWQVNHIIDQGRNWLPRKHL